MQPVTAGGHVVVVSHRFLKGLVLLLALTRFICGTPALAGEHLFNSGAAWQEEFSRVGGESVRFLKSPVTEYLPATVLTLGAFGVTYIYDRDIRSHLSGTDSGFLDGATDVGSFVGNPFVHIGGAAALYGTGILSDSPRLQRIGEELGEALLLADVTGFILKSATGRGRPVAGGDRDDFYPFRFRKDFDSLPSMHTASSFAVAHVLSSETESVPAKILWYAAAGFVGFSRLHQEEHWASDVILGAALGELAGRAVTGYRKGGKEGVRLVPAVSREGAPVVALQGRF